MKIEIGGGLTPRGEGFVNLDKLPSADVVIDLETDPLPYPDSYVDEVYSSHCLEHIRRLQHLIAEITRVCKPGALVEIRVPHYGQQMAMCYTHVHTIGEVQARHFKEFPNFWSGEFGYLEVFETTYLRSGYFDEALRLFPNFSEEQLFRFVPNTCHEIRFKFRVVKPRVVKP